MKLAIRSQISGGRRWGAGTPEKWILREEDDEKSRLRLRRARVNDGLLTPVELQLSIRRVKGRSCLKVYGTAVEWNDRRSMYVLRMTKEVAQTTRGRQQAFLPCTRPRPARATSRHHPLVDPEFLNRRVSELHGCVIATRASSCKGGMYWESPPGLHVARERARETRHAALSRWLVHYRRLWSLCIRNRFQAMQRRNLCLHCERRHLAWASKDCHCLALT